MTPSKINPETQIRHTIIKQSKVNDRISLKQQKRSNSSI